MFKPEVKNTAVILGASDLFNFAKNKSLKYDKKYKIEIYF